MENREDTDDDSDDDEDAPEGLTTAHFSLYVLNKQENVDVSFYNAGKDKFDKVYFNIIWKSQKF